MTSNMEGSSTVEDSAVSADASTSKLPLRRAGSVDSVVLDVDDGHGALPRLGFRGCAAESRKLPSSQYKGVVPQPNGRWGAQIYAKHHRVWLGTFDSEVEAARAYDVAARRFRGRDAVTNLGPVDDEAELEFVGSRSKAEVVDMLRKHTYRDELNQSRRSRPGSPGRKRKAGPDGRAGAGVGRERLFEKVVTPSDVGKLNRLVVPKQHAERHFPLKSGSLLLSFEDECGRVWRFRYSYWNSSQSYVLTKGWSRFVKEKGLKAGGAVVFQRSVGAEKQLYIECKPVGSSAEKLPTAPAIRLFGVDIREDPAALGGKEMEFLPVTKKQCVGDQL